jgi:hypothetical protein
VRGAGVCGWREVVPRLGRWEGVMVAVGDGVWVWFMRGLTPLERF